MQFKFKNAVIVYIGKSRSKSVSLLNGIVRPVAVGNERVEK